MDASYRPEIGKLRDQDQQAWTAFFDHFDSLVKGVAAWPRWHFDAHTREDAVQMIKLGIVHAIGSLKSEEALTAFVKRIAVNRCIDLLRRQLRMQNRLVPLGHTNAAGEWVETDAPADAGYDPVAALQRAERAVILRAALARLEASERTCLLQFYVEGLSYREMAARQDVAVNTVGSRLSRSLDKLRRLLEPAEANPDP